MSCDCHDTEAAHEIDEAAMKAIYLPQWEAERRNGYLFHCPECTREARGYIAYEQCVMCPPGRHRMCEVHQ